MTQAQKERSDILTDIRSLTGTYYRADAVARQQAAKQYFTLNYDWRGRWSGMWRCTRYAEWPVLMQGCPNKLL